MSVNVGQRHIADTPANAQCYAVDSLLTLALHTLKICKNDKIFYGYRNIVMDIEFRAEDMFLKAYSANAIRVTSKEDWEKRKTNQEVVIQGLFEFLALINLAIRLFHLNKKKHLYWIKLTNDALNLCKKWHESDKKRFAS